MDMFLLNESGVSSSLIGSPEGANRNRNMSNQRSRAKRIKRICTWNVKTMAQAGKIQNALREMKILDIEIMGVSEMRWPGSSYCSIENYRTYYSGKDDGRHEHGVGLIVNKEAARHVTNFVPVNERVILLQLNASPININIIQVYAPTSDHSEDEVEEFYSQIKDLIKKLPKQEMLILMGDFNAKVGKGREGKHIGPYGLGVRNGRGETLSVFASEHDLVITNTFYKLPDRRLYTWTSPRDDGEDHIIRNQIDYILVNQRYRNSFTSVKTYPGADIQSDHNPLVGEYRTKFKIIQRAKQIKHNIRKLKNNTIREQVNKDINDRCRQIEEEIVNSEEQIKSLTETVSNIKDKYLKGDEIEHKSWMTEEILLLMKERRNQKNNPAAYKNIQKDIQRKIREAKQKELDEKCREIEDLQSRFDEFNVHRKVREVTGKFKTKTVGKLVDDNGELIVDREDIKDTWEKYIQQLFFDERGNPPSIPTESGPTIMTDEVQAAINTLKDGKATGPDGVNSEFFKLLDDESVKFLTRIFNTVYNTGNIPKEWLMSEFLILPKKQGAKACGDYRTISLMSHMLKLFLKIIHRRIYKVCEERVTNTQFGFMKGVGTRDALFCLQVLFQRCRDMNCNIFACFIDYEKAFDRVQHEKMMEVLRNTGMDDKDLRIIRNLYWNQTATVKINVEEQTNELNILRGVRQGCILSPLIFNLYSEEVFKEAFDGADMGILLNGERLNNIRYADDTVIFADNMNSLQQLINRINDVSNQYGLKININKTKFMVISKETGGRYNLIINNKPIERVTQFSYLGTMINEDWDHSQEIRIRIEKARAAFNQMAKVFKSHSLNIGIKIRLLRCYIFSILFYGMESWTLTEATERRLEAFEMWLYRRILRISWMDKVTNKSVLERMNKSLEVMNTIKKRKLEYLGHIMRNDNKYGLLKSVLQGKVYGKRGPGRRRISWLKNLRTWFSKTTTELFRAAVNKVIISRMIANIRNE